MNSNNKKKEIDNLDGELFHVWITKVDNALKKEIKKDFLRFGAIFCPAVIGSAIGIIISNPVILLSSIGYACGGIFINDIQTYKREIKQMRDQETMTVDNEIDKFEIVKKSLKNKKIKLEKCSNNAIPTLNDKIEDKATYTNDRRLDLYNRDYEDIENLINKVTDYIPLYKNTRDLNAELFNLLLDYNNKVGEYYINEDKKNYLTLDIPEKLSMDLFKKLEDLLIELELNDKNNEVVKYRKKYKNDIVEFNKFKAMMQISKEIYAYSTAYNLPPIKITNSEWNIFFDTAYEFFKDENMEIYFYAYMDEVVKLTFATAIIDKLNVIEINDLIGNLDHLKAIYNIKVNHLKDEMNFQLSDSKTMDINNLEDSKTSKKN